LIVFFLYRSRNIRTNIEFCVEINGISAFYYVSFAQNFFIIIQKTMTWGKKQSFSMKTVIYKNYLRCLCLHFSKKHFFAKLFGDESSLMIINLLIIWNVLNYEKFFFCVENQDFLEFLHQSKSEMDESSER